MIIPKTQCTIMRGWAILFIALHNFLHLPEFGFAQENETRFCTEGINIFLQNLSVLSWGGITYCETVIYNIFSFIGWVGVPVFVFLSGYGLTVKYKNRSQIIGVKKYITHSYLKLLYLILPAVMLVIPYQFFSVSFVRAIKSVFSLTFLNTIIPAGLLNFSLPSSLPTFWYLSLTFQLYLIFLLLVKVKDNLKLATIGIVFLLITVALGPDFYPNEVLLRYERLNCIGWIPFFILGIIIARGNCVHLVKSDIWKVIVIILISFILLFVTNSNYYFWVFLPFVALSFFYSLAVLIDKLRHKSISLWLGKNSMYIFVAHPLAILLFQEAFKKGMGLQLPIVTLLGIYIALFIILALMYKYMHERLLIWFDNKR